MIVSDELSAIARAHVEVLIYGSVHSYVIAHTQIHAHTHALLTRPVMDDEGPVSGMDGPIPGVGESGTDGQDDVLLR